MYIKYYIYVTLSIYHLLSIYYQYIINILYITTIAGTTTELTVLSSLPVGQAVQWPAMINGRSCKFEHLVLSQDTFKRSLGKALPEHGYARPWSHHSQSLAEHLSPRKWNFNDCNVRYWGCNEIKIQQRKLYKYINNVHEIALNILKYPQIILTSYPYHWLSVHVANHLQDFLQNSYEFLHTIRAQKSILFDPESGLWREKNFIGPHLSNLAQRSCKSNRSELCKIFMIS